MVENLITGEKSISVNIKNIGNITDIGKVTIYVNGNQMENVHHYELDPNQDKSIQFILNNDTI